MKKAPALLAFVLLAGCAETTTQCCLVQSPHPPPPEPPPIEQSYGPCCTDALPGARILVLQSTHTNRLTEVVDITCYLDHESKGDKHSSCAQKCIESGMPVGIVAAGKLYAVIVSSHESPNAKLAPFAGKLVTITGKVLERDGLRAVDMEDVQPASE